MANKDTKRLLMGYAIDKLRPYQKKFFADQSRFRIANKSRQIGFTWEQAYECICRAYMLERDQLVISASQYNAGILMSNVRSHLAALNLEPLNDTSEEIELMNGRRIVALATNWRTARGFTGDVVFDEFAFILRDRDIWRAMIPSITAVNGTITVLSSPKSRTDKFWELWDGQDNRFSKHLVTIHDAVRDGLKTNIDELKSLLTPEEFAQAYECIPIETEDAYIPYDLIEPCLTTVTLDHCPGNMVFWGVDIGRTRDETAIVGTERTAEGTVVTYVDQLRRKPFAEQKAFLGGLLSRPDSVLMAIDRGGIGLNLYEDLVRQYPGKVIGYNFAPAVKDRLAKVVKRMIEDKSVIMPNRSDLVTHILSIRRKANATNIFSYDAASKEHHGDKFWALAMSVDLAKKPKVIDYVGVY